MENIGVFGGTKRSTVLKITRSIRDTKYGPFVQICFLKGLEMLNETHVTMYWKLEM